MTHQRLHLTTESKNKQMIRLTFSGRIYLGFSILIVTLLVSLLYLTFQFRQLDVADATRTNIRMTILVTAVLVFALIVWLLVYITNAFKRYKKVANQIGRAYRREQECQTV